MSITDELREWFKDRLFMGNGYAELTAIADRIDAEHESACAEAYGNGVMSVPIALDESAWVELPKDADGVPWNVGDCDEDGNEVIALKLAPDGWYVIAVGEWPYRPDSKRHHHAPTVEDVLAKFALACEDADNAGLEVARIIAEYATKLRLAEGDA